MKEIEEMDDEELVEEYRATVEFRAIESEQGQVTPHEIEFRKALENEILERMD
ncbi:hypothetical protein [Halobacterium salinarum]|uniref:hypothetical protein n=1 Tax=Halobacterium salinarum TaxID=2242 RepID=UPI0025556B67|nr:hypothetical protein [Halobacterium salinarum]MDL0144120.1 hypothetical protein [Halobacterium salinarum]